MGSWLWIGTFFCAAYCKFIQEQLSTVSLQELDLEKLQRGDQEKTMQSVLEEFREACG